MKLSFEETIQKIRLMERHLRKKRFVTRRVVFILLLFLGRISTSTVQHLKFLELSQESIQFYGYGATLNTCEANASIGIAAIVFMTGSVLAALCKFRRR